MKKKVLFLSFILTACDYYTIKNNYMEDVRAGYVVIKSGQCVEFFDFPFLGDFPLKFRYKDHQLMSNSLYQSGHYEISIRGNVLKKNKACDLDPVKQKEELESNQNKESENIEKDTIDKTSPLDSEKNKADSSDPVDDPKSQNPNSDSLKQEESQQPLNPKPKKEPNTEEPLPIQGGVEIIEV